MRTVSTEGQLRLIRNFDLGDSKIAFVPTMGNLHDGHLALVKRAKDFDAKVIVSIFVNPLQFLPTEDFDGYPRTLAADIAKLEDVGADVVFTPDERVMYPTEQTFKVVPDPALADILEGEFRPGFFTGVSTVVMKLFQLVQPHIAVFGMKDFQQLQVIKQMVKQFAMPIEIIAGETVRAADGLALSSRNAYLQPAARDEAKMLNWTIRKVVNEVQDGLDPMMTTLLAQRLLEGRGWTVDYLTVRRKSDLQPPQGQGDGPLIVLAAAKLGTTRLIDNMEV